MPLKIGQKVPDFVAKDTFGDTFDSINFLGQKPIVFYFYPKDNTTVCTQQACSFRDNYSEFKALGAEIIGVSGDTTKSHLRFSQKYELPFRLLSDNDKKIRNLFGVPTDFFGLIPGRVTYVVNKQGIVVEIIKSMKSSPHIKGALKAIQGL